MQDASNITLQGISATLRDFPYLQKERISLLDGSQGTNREREKTCQIPARNDYEAVQCWLNEYKSKLPTFRCYQKESERLLLWCIITCGKPLSSLTRDDFEAYFSFLDDPQPKHIWCAAKGGRNKKRGESGWRPFVGPLQLEAKKTAITVINSLMGYLVDARYLAFNPLLLIRKKVKRSSSIEEQRVKVIERILEKDEWEAVKEAIEEIPEGQRAEKERIRFLIAILFLLGIRVDELEQHHWNAFRKTGDKWWFFLIGKGDKQGMIPVNDELLDYVIYYRTYLEKTPLPTPEDNTPIIVSFRSKDGIGARQINNVIKQLMTIASRKFLEKPEKVKKLERVSAHWFRHLSGTKQSEAGIDEKHIQGNLRHSSVATTRKYNHSQLDERHHEMQKLSLRK